MKNVFFLLFVMMGIAVGTNLQAQTTCTPAQKAECKKLGCDPNACTTAQIATCQKICGNKTAAVKSAAKGVKVVNQSPVKKASCNQPCVTKAAANTPVSPVRLVGLEELVQQKRSCEKPCDTKKSVPKG